MTFQRRIRARLEVLAIVVSIASVVIAPALAWAASRAVAAERQHVQAAALERIAGSLETIRDALADVDRRLSRLEGRMEGR